MPSVSQSAEGRAIGGYEKAGLATVRGPINTRWARTFLKLDCADAALRDRSAG